MARQVKPYVLSIPETEVGVESSCVKKCQCGQHRVEETVPRGLTTKQDHTTNATPSQDQNWCYLVTSTHRWAM
eukprot:5887948-Amphidinium_carterae.1